MMTRAMQALLMAGCCWVGSSVARADDQVLTLVHDGLTRQALVHVPAAVDGAHRVPLLLVLHGGGGNMRLQANDAYYGQIAKADAEGYVVAFPNGYSRLRSGALATWNAGRCCGAARDRGIDDVGFIRDLVARLQRELPIDGGRVFAAGMSNGGMMAYRLACELPDVFRAVASVAGTDNTAQCSPQRPVSVLHIHARDDDRVLFEGGAGQPRRAVTDFTSVPATVARWGRLDGCGRPPVRVWQGEGAYCESQSPCSGGTEVMLCVTEQGGHAWPGGHKVLGGAPGATAFSATDMIWSFFSRQ